MTYKRHKTGDILHIGEQGPTVYGHVTREELVAAFRTAGEPPWVISEFALLRHGWLRWVPAQPRAEYRLWAFPAEPHTRGGFPYTELSA